MTREVPSRWAGHRLLDTVASLWPTARVSINPGRRGPGAKELIFVPDSDDPRVLVPSGHRRASSAALLRFNHFLPIRDRLRRVLAAGGMRMGAERLLAHRITISERRSEPDSIETHLSEVLGQDVVVSLGIGAARANQKPVLQAFDQSGKCLAFVKIGDSDLTSGLVRGEAESLRRIGKTSWKALSVPELIHVGSWNSFDVLVMSALPVRARPPLRRSVPVPPERAMRELALGFAEGKQPAVASPFMQRLRSGALDVVDESAKETYSAALDRISEEYPDTVLAFGAWHGDWTPWNMSWRRRRIQLWDWERFETGVPVGMDRIHYVLSALARAEGFSTQTITRALGLSTGRDYTDRRRQDVLGLLYLASITKRYLTASAASGDAARMRDRAAVGLEMLNSLSQDPRPMSRSDSDPGHRPKTTQPDPLDP